MLNVALKTVDFAKKYGIKVTLLKIAQKIGFMTFTRYHTLSGNVHKHEPISSEALLIYQFPDESIKRINIVTDSVSSGSLFGGVGTALVFAALLANRQNAILRIITRTEQAKPDSVGSFFSIYGIKLKHEVQFIFNPPSNKNKYIDVSTNDTFITTSWWTTASTIKSINKKKVIYLLQEDERMFYPFDYNRLNCESIMRDNEIKIVINSQLLFDHLKNEQFNNISIQNLWFEPAFPKNIYFPRKKENKKLKLFFYARPNNARNLYNLGLDVLHTAIQKNIIDLSKWEIYFVGKDLSNSKPQLNKNYEPIVVENLSWAEYASFLGEVDLGLSLMYTPHPSYPPLDLAASGAICITNRFSNKQDLKKYSENIICADLTIESLLNALQEGILLSQDPGERQARYTRNKLNTDWAVSFNKIYEKLDEAQ